MREKRLAWNPWVVLPNRKKLKYPHILYLWIRDIRAATIKERVTALSEHIPIIQLWRIYVLEEMPLGSIVKMSWITPTAIHKLLKEPHETLQPFRPKTERDDTVVATLYRHLNIIPKRGV